MQFSYKTLIPFLFFLAYFIAGLLIFDDYGISWDEEVQRIDIGLVNYNAAFHNDRQALLSSLGKYHGPVFEIFLIIAEKALRLSDSRDIYLMRHLFTFFVFFIGVIFFYFLIKNHFKNWKIGLIACAMLILNPRIFAESFYNSRDIPFLAVFIIAVFLLFEFFKKQSILNAFFFSLSTAILIDLRIMGILVPAFFAVIIFHRIFFSFLKEEKHGIKFIPVAATFLFTAVFVVLFWPVLWQDTITHFVGSLKSMSHYHWESSVFLLGKMYDGFHIPRYYLPVWFFISNPILFLLLFVTGIFVTAKLFFNSALQFFSGKIEIIIFLGWFFIPIFMVVILNAVVYDGWRHVFFIYPAFVFISLYGIEFFYKASGKLIPGKHSNKHRFVFGFFLFILCLFQFICNRTCRIF